MPCTCVSFTPADWLAKLILYFGAVPVLLIVMSLDLADKIPVENVPAAVNGADV
jgi:hypothetical protein